MINIHQVLPLIQAVLDDESLPRDQHDALSRAADIVSAIRPEVAAFAGLMEEKLSQKDSLYGGNSWKDDSVITLHESLAHREYMLFRRRLESADDAQTVQDAVDVANFAMMIADVCGGLSND